MAWTGPPSASQWPLQPSSCLPVASPGPACASWRSSLNKPSSRPLTGCPGPKLPRGDHFRPSSCLSVASSGPVPASWWPHQTIFSSLPFQVQILPPIGLSRPKSCLTADSPGPASASPQHPQSKVLPFSSPDRPHSCP
uniref:putative uncharacterized protein FLJ92257 n=1 Tax=Callithrix jacchus TaxID=9483 RepID=UPI0023DD223C|nr:putative uncharacterized protein FLJ92257 [Callithrix jacchus]